MATNPKTLLGTQLSEKDQRHALAAYTHRFTRDHVPSWARKPLKPGAFYNVQHASDHDWLAHTRFAVNKDGSLDRRVKSCDSSATWPEGKGFRSSPYTRSGGGANMVGPDMPYYARSGGGARASVTIEELSEVGPHARLRRDRKTGIAWVEDGRTGMGHTCHPNIHGSGSVAGMKRLGHWKKSDRTVRSHGFIYNIDHCSTSMPYDKVARDACRCGGKHG